MLLLGETGVGKEVFAARLHALSPRANKPYIKLNCAAFTPTLLESELFGHEKGAFTGADKRKLGLLEAADGGIVFLTTDGRQPGLSVGMTNFELAQALVRFGAVRGMGLDGGGSSTLAFEGTVLNSPSDGRERAVSTALMLQYYGVYAPPPLETVVSPNGDGVAETQKLAYKVVRPSTVTATLAAPDGSIGWQEAGSRSPGSYDVVFPPVPPPPPTGAPPPATTTAEGRWTLTVTALDDQGLSSTTTRRFSVNSTLGSLRVAPARVVVRPTGGTSKPF